MSQLPQSQRFRPLTPTAPTMPATQGVVGQAPTAGPPPIPADMPGQGEVPKPTGVRPGGTITDDPTFGRPTYNPPGSTSNPTGTTPHTNPVQPNGYRPGPTTTFPTTGAKPQITGTGTPQNPVGQPPQVPRPQVITQPATPIATKPITPETSPVGTNLRGDIYTPGDDPRLTGAMAGTDASAGRLRSLDRGAMQTGQEGRYRSIFGDGQVDGNMDALNGPDRTALAMQKLKDFDAASSETRFNEERDLGRNIAKFGRSGLQANADNFGDIQRRIAGDRGRLANELAFDVADGDINDRFRRVDMETGLQERNADRGFQRTSAAVNTATGQVDRGVNDAFDQFNAAGDLESRIFGQGQQNRNEYRTERGRQDTQAQQTIENRIREFEIQQQLEDAKLRRAALAAQAAGGL